MTIMIVAGLLIAWFGSVLAAYSVAELKTNRRIWHGIAWGRFRDSGDGIVSDHGNCLDHWDCPYD